jgi:hypothetical protein
MRTFIAQIRKTIELKLYYVALTSALSIPEIAGAMNTENGEAKGGGYAAWFDKWVFPRFEENTGCKKSTQLSGALCYGYRCAMLHQGRSQQTNSRRKSSSPYANIMFIEPGYPNYDMHYVLIGGKALLIQLDKFVEEILCGCELWLDFVEGTEPFETNYKGFARRHPQGLQPYVNGVPVIG